jgi:hypothetical protein
MPGGRHEPDKAEVGIGSFGASGGHRPGPGTVLAVLQVRVSARWFPDNRTESIEMQVTGEAGTAVYRRRFTCVDRLTTSIPDDPSS